jgi:hypothetical protein
MENVNNPTAELPLESTLGSFFPTAAEHGPEEAAMATLGAPTNRDGDPNASPPPQTIAVPRTDGTYDHNGKRSEDDEMVDNEEGVRRTDPWSQDWAKVADTKFDLALQDYKGHAKTLHAAICNFVKESNQVHQEWSAIQKAEDAEACRLDEVAVQVHHSTTTHPGRATGAAAGRGASMS